MNTRMSILGRCWLAVIPVAALLLGPYQGELLAEFAVLGAAAAALALAWGYTGLLSFGQSVPFGIGGYAVAWFGLHGGAAGTLTGIAVGAALAAAVSLVIALTSMRAHFDAVGFALLTFIVTLAAAQVAGGWDSVTGGYNGLNAVPGLHLGAIALTPAAQRTVTAAIVAAILLLLLVVVASPLGALLRMVRDNPARAACLGYNVPALRIGVFTGVGALTGLLGCLYVIQAQSVSPSMIDLTTATNLVVWTLIGSRVSIIGPFAATIAVNFAAVELSASAAAYWLLIIGLLFLVLVLVLPDGVGAAARRLLPASWRATRPVTLQRDEAPRAAEAAARLPLIARGVTCRFGWLTAVNGVDLDVAPATLHCLIGPNGAGKSSLLNALSGLAPASAGQWRLGGHELGRARPWTAARLGLSRKFQAPSVAPTLTAGQNLLLARLGTARRLSRLLRAPWACALTVQAWQVLDMAGLSDLLHLPASALSHGQRQMLDLAMTLARPCHVLLLDEPTAGMSRAEADRVAVALRGLADSGGLAILMVEHDMAVIRATADRVTVLAAGEVIAAGTVAEVEVDTQVRSAYLGRPT